MNTAGPTCGPPPPGGMGPGTHLPAPSVVVPGNGWNVEFFPGPGDKIPGIPPPAPPPDGNDGRTGALGSSSGLPGGGTIVPIGIEPGSGGVTSGSDTSSFKTYTIKSLLPFLCFFLNFPLLTQITKSS